MPEESHKRGDIKISRHTERKRSIPLNCVNNAILRVAQEDENSCYSHHTEEQHLQSAECWLKTQAVCKTFQPNVDTFNANVVIGKRKYPVTNLNELSCKKDNYAEITNQLDCFGSKEPHNDVFRHSECNEESHNREDFTNNAILRGLNNCSPQNDGKNSCRLMRGEVNNENRKVAFTLAETLITLGIIGVVAAITIPTLITSYQKQVTVTKLKKVYSTLSQAIERAKVDNGDIQSWGIGDINGMSANGNNSKAVAVNFSEKYIIPYVKNLKSAEYVTPKQFGYDSISNLDGMPSLWLGVNAHKYMIVLNDGTVVGVGVDSMNMGTQENRNDVIWAITFFVDLNGTKGPNVIGHDIFAFIIRTQGEAKFMPFSYDIMSYGSALIGCQQGGLESRLCTYVIMSDGWQIKEHYPWKFKK